MVLCVKFGNLKTEFGGIKVQQELGPRHVCQVFLGLSFCLRCCIKKLIQLEKNRVFSFLLEQFPYSVPRLAPQVKCASLVPREMCQESMRAAPGQEPQRGVAAFKLAGTPKKSISLEPDGRGAALTARRGAGVGGEERRREGWGTGRALS